LTLSSHWGYDAFAFVSIRGCRCS